VLFNNQLTRVVDFGADQRAIDAAMRTVLAGGATALFDATATALIAANDPERRQLVVFFTDGIDTTSITTPATLQTVAEVRKRLFAAGFSVVRVSLLSLLLKPVRITAIK